MGEIQRSLVGSVGAVAAAAATAKESKDTKAKEDLQAERDTELHSLQVKGLKAENRTKRYQARAAKLELEMVRAKARDSLESAREQSKSKKNVKEIISRIGKEKAPDASNK